MISNLAFVHPDARLGKDVIVEPFAYIAGNVVIGDGTWIGPNATIMDGARIGKNCRIFPSAVVSGIPQDLKFRGEETTAEIGDNYNSQRRSYSKPGYCCCWENSCRKRLSSNGLFAYWSRLCHWQ